MKKRIFALLTAAALCTALTGCTKEIQYHNRDRSEETEEAEKPHKFEPYEPASVEYGNEKCLEIEQMLLDYFKGGELDADMLADVTELRIFGKECLSVVCGNDAGTDISYLIDAQDTTTLSHPEFVEYSLDTNQAAIMSMYYYGQARLVTDLEYCLDNIEFTEYMPKLECLEIPCNYIKDLSPLNKCNRLKYLNLNLSIYIEDISPLKSCTQLQTLRIAGTTIKDISVLSDLPDLRILNLSATRVNDLSALSDLDHLETLLISYTDLTDFKQITEIASLKTLDVSATEFDDLSDLNGLDKLEALQVNDTPITSLASVTIHLPSLSALYICDCYWEGELEDISELSSLTSLKRLAIPWCKITDISAMAALTNLEELNIRGNKIDDYTPLYGLSNLRELGVVYDYLTEEQLAALKEALPQCFEE